MSKQITRTDILGTIRAAIEPLDYVHSMWEGGAAANQRLDQWSDIDLMIDVDDDHVPEVMSIIESALSRSTPYDLRYEIPQPTWHGHWQAFYRFINASPYLLLDMVILKHSIPEKFTEPVLHGKAVVHFDKAGIIATSPVLDVEETMQTITRRLTTLPVMFRMFQVMVLKEIERGNGIEAIGYYPGMTLRPLVEALRIRYAPYHYTFYSRYVYSEFPYAVTSRLEPLFFIGSLQDLQEKHMQAVAWFEETIATIDLDEVRRMLIAARDRALLG